jgi:hypothetical protein
MQLVLHFVASQSPFKHAVTFVACPQARQEAGGCAFCCCVWRSTRYYHIDIVLSQLVDIVAPARGTPRSDGLGVTAQR